jgi:hypothetical protein
LCGLARADEKAAGKAAGIKGVTGQLTRVEFDRTTAGKAQKITVPAGSMVEIEYTYPISPPFPDQVGGRSSDPNIVKYVEANSVIVYPLKLGVGRLGAFFKAEKKGVATIHMDISFGSGQGVILQVDVQVQ